jgi:hypothetical protein
VAILLILIKFFSRLTDDAMTDLEAQEGTFRWQRRFPHDSFYPDPERPADLRSREGESS